MTRPAMDAPFRARGPIAAWALWECGSAGLSAIVSTFVFTVYLTTSVGAGLPGSTSPASWLGRAAAAAGLTVALVAPGIGVWVGSPHRRQVALSVLTAGPVAAAAAMALIRDRPSYFWAGLALLAVGAACADLASIPYNAMLRPLSTPQNVGRVSGIGAAAGFLGSVLLLLLVYAGFIVGDGPRRGLLHIPVHDGLNVRLAMLAAAAWFALLALPLLVIVRRLPDADEVHGGSSLLGGYRTLRLEVIEAWRTNRNLVKFLVASALFRDGISAIFGFGAVLGVKVYGISQSQVLIFGVAACTAAALGAVLGGFVDHRIGSTRVIVGSLCVVLTSALAMLVLSGPSAFWAGGLVMLLFVGPVLASSRTLLLRLAEPGKEGVAFGLYTMTGRAAAFVAPWFFSVFVDIFGSVRAGLGGICLVLASGLVAMLGVRAPAD